MAQGSHSQLPNNDALHLSDADPPMQPQIYVQRVEPLLNADSSSHMSVANPELEELQLEHFLCAYLTIQQMTVHLNRIEGYL